MSTTEVFVLEEQERTFLDYLTNETYRLEIGPAARWLYSIGLVPLDANPLLAIRQEDHKKFTEDRYSTLVSDNFADHWDQPFSVPWDSKEDFQRRVQEAFDFLTSQGRVVYWNNSSENVLSGKDGY